MQDWLLLQIQIGIVVLAILILRLFLRKLPKVYSYALWLVVFLRLMIPWNLESPVSMVPSGDRLESLLPLHTAAEAKLPAAQDPLSPPQTGATEPEVSPDDTPQTRTAFTAPPETRQTPSRDAGIRERFPGAFPDMEMAPVLLWAVGFGAVCAYNLLSLHRIRRSLNGASWLKDNVWISSGIPTAFVLGWLRPRIYLPASLCGEELEYILCHENTHIRRKDYLFKNIAFLLTALYWYHPLVWLSFLLMEQDMEMSCDEAVVRQLGADIRKPYSRSLLHFASGAPSAPSTPLAFGENGVQQRIQNILSYKTATKWAGVAGIAVILAAGALLLTTRQSPGPDPAPAPAETDDMESMEIKGGEIENGEMESGEIPDELQETQNLNSMTSASMILEHPGMLYTVGFHTRSDCRTFLDLDGDGAPEQIILRADAQQKDLLVYGVLDYFELCVESPDGESIQSVFGYYESLSDEMWALSLDGEHIYLLLYEDGPSGDPVTHFYTWIEAPELEPWQSSPPGGLTEISSIETDIRECEITPDGIIEGTVRQDVIGSNWIRVRWKTDQDRRIARIAQEVYDFDRNDEYALTLLKPLPLYDGPDGSLTASLTPQAVRLLSVTADFEWILLEGEDQTKGWFPIDGQTVMGQNIEEIFGGISNAG